MEKGYKLTERQLEILDEKGYRYIQVTYKSKIYKLDRKTFIERVNESNEIIYKYIDSKMNYKPIIKEIPIENYFERYNENLDDCNYLYYAQNFQKLLESNKEKCFKCYKIDYINNQKVPLIYLSNKSIDEIEKEFTPEIKIQKMTERKELLENIYESCYDYIIKDLCYERNKKIKDIEEITMHKCERKVYKKWVKYIVKEKIIINNTFKIILQKNYGEEESFPNEMEFCDISKIYYNNSHIELGNIIEYLYSYNNKTKKYEYKIENKYINIFKNHKLKEREIEIWKCN